jgi:homoaconitate hydratase
MGIEVPKLVTRLREFYSASTNASSSPEAVKEPENNKESLDSPPPAPSQEMGKVLTRRTGWILEWDVRRSLVTITEGEGGKVWSQKVC